MQAIAVSVTLHKKITICSLYIPPNDTIKVEGLKHLIKQLSNPFILMGDFNSHNEIWGGRETNRRGKIIESIIEEKQLCLFNKKQHTYLHPGTGTYTAVDLTICEPTILPDYDWKVYEDNCGPLPYNIGESYIPT